MKLVIASLFLISILACSAAYADSSPMVMKGSGIGMLNGDSPKMYTASLKITLHNKTTIDSGYVIMSADQSTIVAKMHPDKWQFAYNNDGSFHATGPATSRQDVSYNLVLDGNRLLSSKAGSLWKISAEMSGNNNNYLVEYLASGKDLFASVGSTLIANVTIPNGNSAQSSMGFFVPLNSEVLRGTTITWQNQDNIGHTIQSINDQGTIIPMFNSAILKTGETFSYKFDKPGVYHYYCSIHPWRIGVVTVS
ncbi:Blue (Type 1) copper domain protein (modular protein) [Nitrosotalea devaniterrae]|uniref:Blue (Type 1) copper domain protein (Modular protein) n=1 Tax=Nitrosotalea devaniterrae TaxID=1078905 RepID=A0A128A4B0_9ARCH|nr:Blue (Type 1) copper domain protein (modular protein) [Candidatus Nitrosotalea devanaterra]